MAKRKQKWHFVDAREVCQFLYTDTDKSQELLEYCNEQFGVSNWKFGLISSYRDRGMPHRMIRGIKFRYEEDAFIFKLAWC